MFICSENNKTNKTKKKKINPKGKLHVCFSPRLLIIKLLAHKPKFNTRAGVSKLLFVVFHNLIHTDNKKFVSSRINVFSAWP